MSTIQWKKRYFLVFVLFKKVSLSSLATGSVMPTYKQTGKMAVNVSNTIHFPDPDIIKRLVITDSGFIFDPHVGKSYSANSIGLLILKYIQDGKNLDQIIQVVIKDFNVSALDAERDIAEFLNSLQGQMK